MSAPIPGDVVRWNALGRELFGDTDSHGLLAAVEDGAGAGTRGLVGHVVWGSGQDTWASLDCLEPVPTSGGAK